MLSYYGVVLLLCRTALDSVTSSTSFDVARIMPAHRAALSAATMVTLFLEGLDADDFSSFWLHCECMLCASLSTVS